jgi:hypothetical protein
LTITATVIADSIADGCPRLTTLQLRYPRFIHSEFMTHRAFSRNASSSRAIPVDRLIQDVLDDTAMPIYWGANKPGMQAGDELESGHVEWILARDDAIHRARRMARMGYHKQIVNRILEPYAHINVLCTATADAYSHFFALRDHPDAQPEIAALARAMRDVMDGSTADHLSENEWHIPYITANDCFDIEREFNDGRTTSSQMAMAISSARCASVSYKTVDGKIMTVDKALAIYDKLAGSDPIHASPFEHIARPAPDGWMEGCRNFTKWHQWRADIET